MRVWLIVCLGLLPGLAFAQGVSAEKGWVRWVPPVSPNSAGYFMLHNESDQDRLLVGASSDVAKAIEIHTVIEKDGASTMTRLESIVVPKQDCVLFEGGGNHIMLIGLKQPLQEGQSVALTLHFQNGETLDVDLVVQKSQGNGHEHHH
jgi:copper(I)-binding protein